MTPSRRACQTVGTLARQLGRSNVIAISSTSATTTTATATRNGHDGPPATRRTADTARSQPESFPAHVWWFVKRPYFASPTTIGAE